MSTWARTPSGDLLLPTIGDGASALVADPVQCAALRIQDGLRLWLGNWQLDQSQGFPWPQALANKQPNLVALQGRLKTAIVLLGGPVVIAVTQMVMAFASATRSLQFAFVAPTNASATIVGGTSGPGGVPYVVAQ